jgi:hypothetical protein
MDTITKLGGFALATVVVFAGAYGAGQLVGPVGTAPAAARGMGEMPAEPMDHLPAGLQVSAEGYTFDLVNGPEFGFRILGPDGKPGTAFRERHEKLMHLIVVRRDLSGFQHLHPAMSPDGTWHVPLRLPEAGSYRAFADFAVVNGPELTLGVDFPVAGDYRPVPLPAASRTAEVDGYTVTLDGTLATGRTSTLRFTVSQDGRPVTDLEPYLGASGHLVALCAGDLAYLHVHASSQGLAFDAEVPSPGTYRLFLQFQHYGQVHTAAFTAEEGR